MITILGVPGVINKNKIICKKGNNLRGAFLMVWIVLKKTRS